jgi:DNA-directed RNA polymerase specialized sigma subunit
MESIPNVDVSTFQELITSWFEVLSKFDNKKITYIMQIYLEEIVKRSDLISKLIPPVYKAIKNMKEDEKEILRICFLETLFTINFRKEIIKSLDISSLDLLKIAK